MAQIPIAEHEYDAVKTIFLSNPGITNGEVTQKILSNRAGYGVHPDRPDFGVNYLVRQAAQRLKGEAIARVKLSGRGAIV